MPDDVKGSVACNILADDVHISSWLRAAPFVFYLEIFAHEYLFSRRSLGFDLKVAGRQLIDFAHFADKAGHQGTLTKDIVVSWAQSAPNKAAITWGRRLEIVRPFAKYLQQFDLATEIPESNLFGRSHRRLTPHIYTFQEINDLLIAAAALSPTDVLRPVRYVTLFGLLATTGLERCRFYDARVAN